MLYPEVGRLLAYQGAELTRCPGCGYRSRVLYEKLRAGMLARMQDNQLFAAISFLVGHNEFSRRQRDPFVGRSSVLAPQELTPRASGILVEASNSRTESVLSAVWDFEALAELWETSDTPVRSHLPLDAVGPALAQLYKKMNQLPKGPEALLAAPEIQEPEPRERLVEEEERIAVLKRTKSILSLDDLPVLASVTSYWGDGSDQEIKASLPAHVPVSLTPESDAWEIDETSESNEIHALAEPEVAGSAVDEVNGNDAELREGTTSQAVESQAEDGEGEEETQEMDALPRTDG